MTSTIHFASALMGSGKTRSMIKAVETDRLYIVAAPKLDLSQEIAKQFSEMRPDINIEAINSDSVCSGSTVRCEAIEAICRATDQLEFSEMFGIEGNAGKVILVTHATLTNLPPDIMGRCTVIVDEVPSICRNNYKTIFSDQFDRLFDGAVKIDQETGELSLENGMKFEATTRLYKARSAELHHEEMVYDGLLNPTSEVTAEHHPKAADKYILKSIGYIDLEPVFRGAEEVHVMGNAIRKTLFYLYIQSRGFSFEVSEFTPTFDGYKLPPKMVPLIKGERFSKSMMLTRPDGTKADKFDETTFGWQLMKEALDYHAGEPVLFHGYDWMKTFFDENRYPNVVVIGHDSRGLNEYRDYHRSAHMLHGNAPPVNSQMNQRMLEIMGVDPAEGNRSLRHEAHVEPVSQAMLRGVMRKGSSQEQQMVSVVPTTGFIDALRDNLGMDVEVDASLLRKPPEAKEKTSHSPAKESEREAKRAAKQEKREAALRMLAEGCSFSAVSRTLPVDRKTVRKWAQEERAA